MGRIVANVSITNLLDRQAGLHCNALVDTGAAHMVLEQEGRLETDLRKTLMAQSSYADPLPPPDPDA